MGDAAYVPFREHNQITHLVNVAAEAQPPVNPEGLKDIFILSWHDSESQVKSVIKGGFK